MHVLLNQFGERLKELRLEREESQETFAHTLDLNRSQYWRLEKGRTNPTLLLLHRMSQQLELTLSELLEGIEDLEIDQG